MFLGLTTFPCPFVASQTAGRSAARHRPEQISIKTDSTLIKLQEIEK